MKAPSTETKNAGYSLAEAGWQHQRGSPGKWSRQSDAGAATLVGHEVSSDWQAWFLTSAAHSQASSKQILPENALLPALCKLVDLSTGTPGCRFDLPLELLRNTIEAEPAHGIPSPPHALQAWAMAVTAAATSRPPNVEPPSLSAEELAQWLERNGWPSSSENDVVRVNAPLPGMFCQIVIDSNCPLGTRLWCELAEMTSWSAACCKAARALAAVANERLRLVRLASEASGAGERLLAEIILPTNQIPGVWLTVALEALHAAIRLTARELSALRDPELARWTLAAIAA